MPFTVAFVGARDNYQVPLALYESRMLSVLVTDFYAPTGGPSFKAGLLQILRQRQHPQLPSSKVRTPMRALERSILRPRLLKSLGLRPDSRATAKITQQVISRSALRAAEQTSSDLFLYAGYAHEAFTDPRSKTMKKIVFMYHPHILLASEILLQDSTNHPSLAESTASIQEDLKDRTNDTELQLADLVICASTFTAKSVRHIGIPAEKIRVVPYGIEPPSKTQENHNASKRRDISEFLFVGSGIHRKGLHILLQAWKAANPPKARLTVVSRNIVREISDLLDAPNVRYLPGVTDEGIEDLYRSSDIFVLPSLVEGFGYVYLEALSHGCFCIGTPNTGLPDLSLNESVANVITAGDSEKLSRAILDAAHRQKLGIIDRREIIRSIESHTWGRFRRDIVKVCSEIPIKAA